MLTLDVLIEKDRSLAKLWVFQAVSIFLSVSLCVVLILMLKSATNLLLLGIIFTLIIIFTVSLIAFEVVKLVEIHKIVKWIMLKIPNDDILRQLVNKSRNLITIISISCLLCCVPVISLMFVVSLWQS